MPTFRVSLASALLVALAVLASPARAATLWYEWTACGSGTVSEPWLGAGKYRQVLYATGLPADAQSVDVGIVVGPSLPDAWRFSDANVTGCQPASALTIDPNAPGCPLPPVGYTVTETFEPGLTDPRWQLRVHGHYDGVHGPAPTGITPLAVVVFDHSQSVVTLSGIPGTCGGVGAPLCFALGFGSIEHADHSIEAMGLATDQVRWNDPDNTLQCPGAVPAAARTWGWIKSIYH